MEAARLTLNSTLSKASEAVVIYRGRWQFVVAVGRTSFFTFWVLLIALVGNLFILVYGAMVLGGLAFLASQHCSRVELCRNGKLVVHYFVRRNVTTWIEDVSEIDRDDGEWSVSFNRGTFRMSRNRSATSLVHALMRRKPTIELSGYTLPEL